MTDSFLDGALASLDLSGKSANAMGLLGRGAKAVSSQLPSMGQAFGAIGQRMDASPPSSSFTPPKLPPPPDPNALIKPMRQPLYSAAKQALADYVALQPHQERARQGARKQLDETGQSRQLLYWGLGRGKSLGALAAAGESGEPFTAIVPASLRENFRKEENRFLAPKEHGAVQSYTSVAKGDPIQNPGNLVIDEAQRLRNAESAQTKGVLDAAHAAKQVTLLSGTPVVNGPGDFAPIYSALTGEDMSPEQFTEHYIREVPEQASWLSKLFGGQDQPAGVKNEEELAAKLRGKIDFEAGAGAPGVRVNTTDVPVDMSTDQSRLYKAMYGQLPTLLRWKLEHDYPIHGAELKKLQSFMSGPRQVGLSTLPFNGGQAGSAFDSSPKLQEAFKRLQTRFQANPNAKALIFSNYVNAGLSPYQAGLDKAGIPAATFSGSLSDVQRKQIVDDYNTGKIRALLLGPSGTEGLSTKGTRLVQLLDRHWNKAREDQSIGRALRFDSHSDLPENEKQVEIERFVSKLPPSLFGRLGRRFGINVASSPAADDHLAAIAERKTRMNEALLKVIQRIGSEGR